MTEKGASQTEARYAAEWLEAIGALNDAEYAALLVRHCANLGYGPGRYRDELYRHGPQQAVRQRGFCNTRPHPEADDAPGAGPLVPHQ